jgi:PEP-CTERM/exosortase A-associated glycosyltransferase
MKVLHILDHYKPHFSGYVFRSSYILKYQKELGIDPVVVTSPKHGKTENSVEAVDGITNYRTDQHEFGNIPFVKEWRLIAALEERITEAVRNEKPDLIHAHSPSLNGIAAVRAGKKLGIPVVYEVRAFWEDAAVDHGTFNEDSLKYKISRIIETGVLKKAQSVFALCEGVKREMLSRGIPESKITVIQNCVDMDKFAPVEYDQEISEKYGLDGNLVFGFIGSFYYYEGLDILIDSYRMLIDNYDDVKLLLVGDGPAVDFLHEKAERMKLNGQLVFTGKIPHQIISRYYSVIDVFVYPRKKMRLTDLVTPLKPLEAMAMGKIVAGSDVGGIKELITDNEDGYLFRADSARSLTQKMSELYENRSRFEAVSRAAQDTVRNKHGWKLAVQKYMPVYEQLLGNPD